MKFLFYGAGSLGVEIWNYISDTHPEEKLMGYYDDAGPSEFFERTTKLKFINIDTQGLQSGIGVLICSGSPAGRKAIALKIEKLGGCLASYIHHTCVVSAHAELEPGVIMFPFSVASIGARIGKGSIINSYSGIGHHAKIGNYSVLSSQVDVAGYAEVGEECFLGSGSRIAPKKKIGSGSQVSIGVSVVRSCAPGTTFLPVVGQSLKGG